MQFFVTAVIYVQWNTNDIRKRHLLAGSIIETWNWNSCKLWMLFYRCLRNFLGDSRPYKSREQNISLSVSAFFVLYSYDRMRSSLSIALASLGIALVAEFKAFRRMRNPRTLTTIARSDLPDLTGAPFVNVSPSFRLQAQRRSLYV